MISNEIWKDIIDSRLISPYQVSNLGNVKNKKTGKLLKPRLKASGSLKSSKYFVRSFTNNGGKPLAFSVHRLVLQAFKPIDDCSRFEVHHIDGNTLNNNLNNLEWVNPTIHRKLQIGKKRPAYNYRINTQLFVDKLTEILQKYIDDDTIQKIQKELISK